MANNIIGAHDSIGPERPSPRRLPPQPHWNTATTTPYAAPMESRLRMTAFSGTSTDRKTVMSRMKLKSSTAPMNHGSRLAR